MKKVIFTLIVITMLYLVNTFITYDITIFWSAEKGKELELIENDESIAVKKIDSPHFFYSCYQISKKGGFHSIIVKSDDLQEKFVLFTPFSNNLVIEQIEGDLLVSQSYFSPKFE